MKLITEEISDCRFVAEAVEGKTKNYFIEGIFLQGKIKNRNGRSYATDILSKEVKRYCEQYVSKNRAYGELGHPSGPTINLDRVSHIIKELRQDGDNFIGRAKVTTETGMGKIVKALLDEGCNLGVSSRGMGTLRENNGVQEVQNDFYLATAADIVADPSAPEAFVNGVMESAEWVWDNGIFKKIQLEQIQKEVNSAAKARRLDEAALLKQWNKLFAS